jgi:hypothetical protein
MLNRMVFVVFYLDESIVELELLNVIWTCLELFWVLIGFHPIEDICYSMRSNIKFKIAVFALVFLIIDVMSRSQNEIFGDEHPTAHLFLLHLV